MHDVVLAGGAEASITKIGIGGFNALTALSTTEDPERSSIPFDKDRNGLLWVKVLGFLLLKLGTCAKRGANILVEIVGYGSNCDAYHVLTTPTPDGYW